MKLNVSIIPALILLLVTAGSCGGTGATTSDFIDLSGKWKIIEAGDNAPAALGYNDSMAEEITIPGDWKHVLEKNDDLTATLWIRKKFVINKDFPKDLSDRMILLSLGNIAVSDKTYVNGSLIGSTGSFPEKEKPLAYRSGWHKERNYQFNSSLLHPDGENVVAIKVFSHYINGMTRGPAISTKEKWQERVWLREYLPPLNNFYPIILTAILAILLFITLKGELPGNFSLFSMVLILCVSFIDMLMLGIPSFDNNIYRFKLFIGLYVCIDFILVLLLQEFFKITLRKVTIALSLMLAAGIALIAYAPSMKFLVSRCYPIMSALIIIYVLYATGIFLAALYRDPRRFWYLSIIAVFIILSATDTLYNVITNQFYKISFIFTLRLPFILLGGAIVYLFDIHNLIRENGSLASALLDKTKELQRTKKLVAKIKIKPEPRDIIHDVVEYLDNNFNETYDRKKLAEKFGLNEDYMCNLFRKVTDTNIANYINMRRIEAARQLLKETDSKVIDIAFHVGFDNLTYFYRHFKKHTGYSPIEYRSMVRENAIPIPIDDEI